ncbi:MAG: glycosyltransferase family 1 protein [Pseudomonadota bacterium]
MIGRNELVWGLLQVDESQHDLSFDFCSGIYGFQAKSMAVFSDEMRRQFARRGIGFNEISVRIPEKIQHGWIGFFAGVMCRYFYYPCKVRLRRRSRVVFIADSANAGIYNFLPAQTRVAVFLHGLAYQQDFKVSGIKADLKDRIIQLASRVFKKPGLINADLIFTNSERGKKDFLAFAESRAGQEIIVAPLGVARQFRRVKEAGLRAKLGIPTRAKIILSVAAPDLRKNIDVVVDALGRLGDAVGDWVWVHIGGLHPSVSARMPRQIAEKGIFLRQVENADMPAFYSMADVFVLPTQYDTFGWPPLEAAACGCPVITSNIEPLNENLRDIALFVEPSDAQKLAELMIRVLNDGQLARELSAKGGVVCERFSWERTAEIVVDALHHLLARVDRP